MTGPTDDGPFTGFRDRERGSSALLIIDMIGPMQFEGVADFTEELTAAGEVIAGLRKSAHAAGVPVIYVNDNFGEWHSEASRLVERAEQASGIGRSLAERLRPTPDDYFVIKPQFSGFYATNLPVLLPKLGVSRLILTGIAADVCVLFTAGDAHMRDYEIWAPEDAVVAQTPERKSWALEIMRQSMKAETRGIATYPLQQWMADHDVRDEMTAG